MTAVYRSAAGAAAVRERYDALLDRWPVPSERRFGAHDVLLDQRDAAAKLREALPGADVRLAGDAGHFLPGWAGSVVPFLEGARP
ncbi:hypothetical protein AB0M80_14490 [Amycolatopsis sp. NPDC051045]|uniref:hypothetical protein n=1 Tax=Amycolatopsis sp. NPDC051045 TaxID=3156922 RepID=UPI00342292D8